MPETALLPLPAGHPEGDTESWAAALGVVLARYEGVGRPVLAALVTDTDDDAPGAPVEGVALVPVAVDGANTLGTLDKQVRAAVAAGLGVVHRGATARGGGRAGGDPARHHRGGTGLRRPRPGGGPARRGLGRVPAVPAPAVPGDRLGGPRRRGEPDAALRLLAAEAVRLGIADQFLRHVCRVHGVLLEVPDTPVSDVRLLDEDELDHLDALG
ncbi:hypothetical protein LUW77_01035 [Streptomyces radiopugnans]|nr:hypothetical protein LUW77_01035 [Streptomyces radiopugnans]